MVEEQSELGPERILNLVSDHRHAGRQRVARAERARDEIDGLRELILELLHPSPLCKPDGKKRYGRYRDSANRRQPHEL